MRVLISGAASGIGAAAVKYFASKADEVYGIDIIPCEDSSLAGSFIADVSDEESLLAVKEKLSDSNVTFDVLISVAGIHRMASLVETDTYTLRRVVEVNLIGAMMFNRIFHSLLVAKGRVVIVTSEVAALDPMPFNGLYSMSKTALDSYSQALRQELNLLGQKVVTVRPGAIKTPLCQSSLDATARLSETTELYKNQSIHFLGITKKFMGEPMPPQRLAKIIYKASSAKHPRLNYNKHRNPGLVLLGVLPRRVQCAVIKLLLNRKAHTRVNKTK